jgi:A/G-specific adenine glycosylase
VYAEFKRKYMRPERLASDSRESLLGIIGSLGLRWRAPLMIKMAGIVADRGVPDHYDELVALPGVGSYAAAAYLSLHRHKRAAIIDSNVVRWVGRMFGVRTDAETRRSKWLRAAAEELTPARSYHDYNYAVLDFGMKVCAPRPRCEVCPFAADICKYAARLRPRSSLRGRSASNLR